MSDPQESTEPRTPPTTPPAALPRRSWLAVASATMGSFALLTSCLGLGISGLLAAFLGMIALDRIRREAPTLRGRAFAWAGIGLGLTATILSALAAWGYSSLQREWHDELDRTLQATFAGAEESSAAAALDGWIGREGATIAAPEIAAFAREAEARYGRFIGFKELSEEREGGFRSVQRVIVTVNFDFEKGSRLGSMGFCFITDTRSLLPELRLDSIAILDGERGNLRIPESADADAGPGAEPGAAAPKQESIPMGSAATSSGPSGSESEARP